MIPRQKRKWLWTFVFVGVVLCFSAQSSSSDTSDDKDEIKAILGTDPVQAVQQEADKLPPAISSAEKNVTSKLKIVVSSINEGGVKEDGQVATDANVSPEVEPVPVEEKAVAKNNQVHFAGPHFMPALFY